MLTDIVLLLTGIVVGAMNAIAGGGMLIGFPVLLAFGIPPLVANASGGIISVPGQISSAFGYRKYLRRVPLRYAFLLIPCVIGCFFGTLTLRNTSPEHFANIVPLLVLFGIGLFAFQPLLHFHLHMHIKKRSQKLLPVILLGIALLPISFYGGYFGVGYGFMVLAFLGLTSLSDAHMMNAMKNVGAIFITGTAVIGLLGSHLINWHIGLIMGAGAFIGGYIGSQAAQRVSSHWLRIFVITFGLVAVVYLSIRQY